LTDLDPTARLLLRRGADVDAQVGQTNHGLAALGVEQMHGSSADHAGDAIGPDPDRLADPLAIVDAADRLEAQGALAIDAGHHETDLVHVSGDHHAFASAAPAAMPDRQHRA